MNVTACLVTRGDVDLDPVLEAIPEGWASVVYDNSKRVDQAVAGRYVAVGEALDQGAELVYVQDDDCVLPPESIHELVYTWRRENDPLALVANMPAPFRGQYEDDSCLVGFGAVFAPALAEHAFGRWNEHMDYVLRARGGMSPPPGLLNRVADVIFTTLAPRRVLVDVPYENLPWATSPSRMYRQPGHVGERATALQLARAVRDAC